jgi:hypothetical protein
VSDTLSAGDRIGAFEVEGRLGAGGMGEVYKARDTRLGRTVAIKVLRSGADPEWLRRLQREAQATSALNHPNIVQIYDVGEAQNRGGAYYVVMELVDGETLRRRLRPGPLPMPELLDLGAQLAEGLAKAHRAGIVHRDLKPENVMVTPEGVVKILDFGLAKLVTAPLADVEGETLSRHGTRAGTLLGTLEYMSPEQASGRAVDHRTDQFALGAILHEMATGRPAFRRDTPAQVLAAVIERDPERLGRLRGDVPQALESLVARCLTKDPGRRYEKTDDVAAELSGLAGRTRSGSLVEGARSVAAARPVVSAEIVPTIPPPLPPQASVVWHVQDGLKVKDYHEPKLVDLIRKGKLSGLELVRRGDEEAWGLLYASQVYRREVPSLHDPRTAAAHRALGAVGAHLSGWVITAVVMYSVQGNFPFWLWIWGAVLGMQALGSLPALWPLIMARSSPPPAELPPAEKPRPPALAEAISPIAQEAARVRALISQKGGADASRLLTEVDGIAKLTDELSARQTDLEEQTSDGERKAVAEAIAQARSRLERAELEQDRRLFERQLDVLQGREDGIRKAMRVLERLKIRREVAEHQLKQLRLDLSRGAASGVDLPELSSRLQFIRDEIDAREEIAEIAAERR